MRRIVSVFLPHWPIERRRRARPGSVPDEAPFVLALPRAGALIVHARNRAAIEAGVREGEVLADARARVPDLASAPAEPEADMAALRRLALWCGRYGAATNVDRSLAEEPPAADEALRALWIDASGVAHLYGGEAGLLADLDRRMSRLGLSARLGMGPTPGAAAAIALCLGRRRPGRGSGETTGDPRVLPDREDALMRALAALPIEGLRLSPASALLLRRLGLKRIGQLYAVPRAALARRFDARETAAAVLERLDQALGRKPEPLVPLRPAPEHAARESFAEPIVTSEALLAVLATLAERLCADLAAAELGARRLRLALYRVDGACLETGAGTSAPTRTPAHMLRLLEHKLEAFDLGLGIDALTLAAVRTERLGPTQAGLTTGPGRNAAELACLIDRLAGRLGSDRVLRLAPRASHIPERAEQRLSALAAAPAGSRQDSRPQGEMSGPPRPPLLLPAPEPIAVTAEIPEGPPARFTWRRLARRITRAEGPERLAPEWWHEIGTKPTRTRDYYRIEDETGARYWVFREGLYQERGEAAEEAPRWFLHGLYG
jgi:protein ImuB